MRGGCYEGEAEQLLGIDASAAIGVEPGDLWLLGDHRLYCGSSLERSSFEALMGDERARMVFSDPPFNVKIDGHVSGLGKVSHEEFQMAAGEISRSEFTDLLTDVFALEVAFSIDCLVPASGGSG